MVKVNMVFDSEKKHSYRYNANNPQPDRTEGVVTSIYISKQAFDGEAPKEIIIDIEEVR